MGRDYSILPKTELHRRAWVVTVVIEAPATVIVLDAPGRRKRAEGQIAGALGCRGIWGRVTARTLESNIGDILFESFPHSRM